MELKQKIIDLLNKYDIKYDDTVDEYILKHKNKFDRIKNVPEYFEEDIDKAARKCNEEKQHISNGGMFFFTTDVHLHENPMSAVPLVRRIAEATGINKLFCGGDIPWAFGTKEKCVTESFLAYELMSEMKDSVNLYIARGNHDFTTRISWEDENGYTMPYKTTRDIIMSYQSDGIHTPDENSLYFYVDDGKEKIRYIVLDTCSKKHSDESKSWGIMDGFDSEQRKWLTDEALYFENGSGWSVVVIGHISCVPSIDSYNSSLDELAEILKDFKNKRKSADWDFSGSEAEFVAYICGHNHMDCQSVEDNTLFVSTGSTSALWDDCWDRNIGTVEEELFDIFIVDKDKKTLKAIRVGAGEDREFCY